MKKTLESMMNDLNSELCKKIDKILEKYGEHSSAKGEKHKYFQKKPFIIYSIEKRRTTYRSIDHSSFGGVYSSNGRRIYIYELANDEWMKEFDDFCKKLEVY